MPAGDAILTLPAADLFRSERRIVGSFYGSAQVLRDMPTLVRLAEAGLLDIGSVISRRIGLADVGEALLALEHGDVLRSVILPGT
jgi:S-(hydroxymethyl)glutathione dehydrogenase/alcohol dehydrogenase